MRGLTRGREDPRPSGRTTGTQCSGWRLRAALPGARVVGSLIVMVALPGSGRRPAGRLQVERRQESKGGDRTSLDISERDPVKYVAIFDVPEFDELHGGVVGSPPDDAVFWHDWAAK